MQIKLCYFNQHWNIYLYTKGGYDSWINDVETTTITDNRGEYRLRKYNQGTIPLYAFGFMAKEPKERPGHGGEWSSNSTQINKVFGTDLYEVAVDQISAAVPLEWLKEQLGDRVVWSSDPIYREFITEIKGEENQYHKWVELPLLVGV